MVFTYLNNSSKFQIGCVLNSNWPITFGKTVSFAECDWSIHISVLHLVGNQPESIVYQYHDLFLLPMRCSHFSIQFHYSIPVFHPIIPLKPIFYSNDSSYTPKCITFKSNFYHKTGDAHAMLNLMCILQPRGFLPNIHEEFSSLTQLWIFSRTQYISW